MKGLRVTTFIILLLSISLFPQTNSQPVNITSSLEVEVENLKDTRLATENYEEMNLSSLDLSLYLNETDGTVLGNMTVDFFNSDPVPFSRIPFHLYLSGMYADGRLGYIDILNVSELTPSPVQLDFNVYSEDQIMWVNLTDDLQPDTSILLEIDFESVLPIDSPDRAGVSGYDIDSSKIYEFASAYPIPCVYDEFDGWNTDPYLDTGDPFYFDMAYYSFDLTLPNDMKVAATGELSEVDVGSTKSTFHYNLTAPVREITFCASYYYVIESQMYNGINVSSYYLPESTSLWSTNGLDWGVRSLALFNDTFGSYPYTTLNIVEDYGFYYGMEYPCQVYLSNLINDRYQASQISAATLDAVIAHEVAHQWWYQLVGNDEIDVGFLDEGLTVWSVYYYSEYYDLHWPGKDDGFYYVKMTYPAIINQSIYDNESTYYFTAYTKTPVVLEKLRQIIGDDDYLDSLRLFFSRFNFRIAFLQDLQSAFEDQLISNLDWFFVPMFDNGYLPDYTFTSVEFNQTDTRLSIVIEDLNEDLHVQNYLQNFSIEVEFEGFGEQFLAAEYVAFHDIQLYGTTQVILTHPSFSSSTPSRVTLLYDEYSLVQLDDPHVRYISTSEIHIMGIETTPTTSFTPQPTVPPNMYAPPLYLMIGIGIGAMALVIVAFAIIRKKS